MKALMLALLTLALAGLGLSLLWGMPFWAAGFGLVVGGVLGLDSAWGAVRRDRAVRRLLVAAYDADAPHTSAGDLVRVLNTPDVWAARRGYLRREETRYASMYANGECSGR